MSPNRRRALTVTGVLLAATAVAWVNGQYFPAVLTALISMIAALVAWGWSNDPARNRPSRRGTTSIAAELAAHRRHDPAQPSTRWEDEFDRALAARGLGIPPEYLPAVAAAAAQATTAAGPVEATP